MLLCLRRLSNGTRFASTFASCSACRVRSRASTPNIAANDSRPAASYPPALWCADEGTSRMQTSLRRRQRDRVVRRSVPLPSNSGFNSQPLPKRASTDRMQSSVPEQRFGDDDRIRLRAFLAALNACTRTLTRTHLTLCSCAVRHRRRPPALCRHKRRIEPLPHLPNTRHLLKSHRLPICRAQISSSPSGAIDDSRAETHCHTSRPEPTPHPRSLDLLQVLRTGGPHRIGCHPTRPAHAPNPHLTTTPARVQTCNFDVLYAYLSTPFHIEHGPQHCSVA